ncbi:MAG: hypothetical protein AAB837_01065 [Patescibacteria group bacterium]
MPILSFSSIVDDMADQVSLEYAKLKRAGVEKVDFSQLLMNVITGNGVKDPTEISKLRSQISAVCAQRRAEKTKRQAEFRFRRWG